MTLFYDTSSMFRRYLTKVIRNRTLLATNLGTSVLFLVLFSQLLGKFGSFLPASPGGYVGYLVPGVLLLTAATISPLGGVSIVNDLNSGFLSKMLLSQVSRPAILLGRLLTDMTVAVAQGLLTLIVALALGVTISSGVAGAILLLLTIGFVEFALSGIFLVTGMKTRKTETISGIGNAIFYPVLFLSSAMFPVSFFPSWAQTISSYNPISYASDATRQLIQGGFNLGTFASAYAFIGAIAIVTFAGTLYQFRKVIS